MSTTRNGKKHLPGPDLGSERCLVAVADVGDVVKYEIDFALDAKTLAE